MKDLMLDLETWGKRYGCAIRSIGAVAFDRYGTGLGEEFYVNVDDVSSEWAGMTRDADTVAWWSRQSADAQTAFQGEGLQIHEAIMRFSTFFRRAGVVRVWSQGANFDEPIIVGAFDLLKIEPPWKFWNSRCTRTIYDAAGLNFNAERRVGVAHHALHDAIHQARCVQKAFSMLGKSDSK